MAPSPVTGFCTMLVWANSLEPGSRNSINSHSANAYTRISRIGAVHQNKRSKVPETVIGAARMTETASDSGDPLTKNAPEMGIGSALSETGATTTTPCVVTWSLGMDTSVQRSGAAIAGDPLRASPWRPESSPSMAPGAYEKVAKAGHQVPCCLEHLQCQCHRNLKRPPSAPRSRVALLSGLHFWAAIPFSTDPHLVGLVRVPHSTPLPWTSLVQGSGLYPDAASSISSLMGKKKWSGAVAGPVVTGRFAPM